MIFNDIVIDSLLTNHFLVETDSPIEVNNKYYNAYLLSNFGIVVDKPSLLSKTHVQLIADKFHLTIPQSFYKNPQDIKYFSRNELLIEQLVAYFVGYGTDLGRIEIFKKDLPEYVVGDELKLRTFYIISEDEAIVKLEEQYKNLCSYSRPFSTEESSLFKELYLLFSEKIDLPIKCKDNIFLILPYNVNAAKSLDKKDLVKFSRQCFGEHKLLSDEVWSSIKTKLSPYISLVQDCPLTKKQAKYFNKLKSICGLSTNGKNLETNNSSPDKIAWEHLRNNDVIEAAKVYAANGSMLQRRLKMLLVRANPSQQIEILGMLPSTNPIVLYQIYTSLFESDTNNRTFTYYYNNKLKSYTETYYEAKYRKTKLTDATRDYVAKILLEKISQAVCQKSSLGKVYIADNFYKLALPTNTSASNKGIDVLPTGSRLPCTGSAIRTFVHWKDAFDIDSSLTLVYPNCSFDTLDFRNYYYMPERFGLGFSGDITGRSGAEFWDLDLDALKSQGVKYVLQSFHGYNTALNVGEIFTGFQNKDTLDSCAWDPKNIEMQFKVYGDSTACNAFAIDVETREIIILNQIMSSSSRVVSSKVIKAVSKYLHNSYLNISIGLIAALRGELVSDPNEADVIFDDEFKFAEEIAETKDITLIRSWELEKLVALINS